MKKYLFLLVFALSASVMQAQQSELYSMMCHDIWPEHSFGLVGLIQQRDGDFITSCYVTEDDGNFNFTPVGTLLYKISQTSLTVIDSLFIDDTTFVDDFSLATCCLAQNPNGEGNLAMQFEYHRDCDSSFLRISHFPDNNLSINHAEDVLVPVCEGSGSGTSIIDSQGDVILQYFKPITLVSFDMYMARIGLDGTLKNQALLYENFQGLGSNLQQLGESPMRYYQWLWNGTYNGGYENISVCVTDSLFQKNPVIISSILSEEHVNQSYTQYEYLFFNGDTQMIPIDGDNILIGAMYVRPTSDPMVGEYGTVVVKYDLRTMQMKNHIVFNDYPGYYRQAECLGLKMMTDGTVYFMYHEEGYPDESFVAVKMDTDLNMEWKRFCKTNVRFAWLSNPNPILYKNEQGEEEGFAGITNEYYNHSLILFCLNHEGPVGTGEGYIEVRPYAFYPNPTEDRLRFQYSPDVQPKQIDLYDLQGRLVQTQSGNFESIDLSRLAAGSYTMRVTLNDGKSYADKVVKE